MAQDPSELPPPGRLIVDDDGSRVQCHTCGRWWPKVGMHVRQGHGMSPDEYRRQFGLKCTAASRQKLQIPPG